MATTKQPSLLIYQKYVDLIQYAYELLKKYPKAEKYAMTAHIKESMFAALKTILRANKIYRNPQVRVDMLNTLDAELHVQKVLVRLSHQQRYINNNNYLEWSKRLDEIGRLVGGWIKATVGGADGKKP